MTYSTHDQAHPAPVRASSRGRALGDGALDLGPLTGFFGYNLRKAQLALSQSFPKAIAPHDMTLGQFGVLVMIHENRGVSQSDLGSAVGIDRSTMVAVIDRLEGRGLVVRAPSPHDRRSYALRLSAEGERLLAELLPRVERFDQALMRDLSSAERAQLLDLLRRVTGNEVVGAEE